MTSKLSIIATTMFLASLTVSATFAAEPYHTGQQDFTIDDPNGTRVLEGVLWYPTLETSGIIEANGNAVFEPIKVIRNAKPASTKMPLLVMSHGMFGNFRNQAWLASALTAKGYMVAALDHPGTSSFKRDPDHRRQLWERPRDISRALDHILTMDQFATKIDQARIYMAGHSLGGYTAVMLAGGQYDPDKVDQLCGGDNDTIVCQIVNGWQIAKTPEDRIEMAKNYGDPRIKAFAVLDLGGTQLFSPESLSKIDRPLFVIGAPVAGSGINLDDESRALSKTLTHKQSLYWEPESVGHFDFLGVCTEKGLFILKEEEPDDVIVCMDGRDARRKEQAMIVERVDTFFKGLDG